MAMSTSKSNKNAGARDTTVNIDENFFSYSGLHTILSNFTMGRGSTLLILIYITVNDNIQSMALHQDHTNIEDRSENHCWKHCLNVYCYQSYGWQLYSCPEIVNQSSIVS